MPPVTATTEVSVARVPSIALRTRRDWANDPDHASAYPDHIGACPVCSMSFDARINQQTGLHHEKRPADYCSARCQNTAEGRRKRRGYTAPNLPTTEPLRDVRSILNRVRIDFANHRAFTGRLFESEWTILTSEAPTIADGLRYFNDYGLAVSRATANLQRVGRVHADRMRRELVARIDQWFVAHSTH